MPETEPKKRVDKVVIATANFDKGSCYLLLSLLNSTHTPAFYPFLTSMMPHQQKEGKKQRMDQLKCLSARTNTRKRRESASPKIGFILFCVIILVHY
jgi:hypothetical protein